MIKCETHVIPRCRRDCRAKVLCGRCSRAERRAIFAVAAAAAPAAPALYPIHPSSTAAQSALPLWLFQGQGFALVPGWIPLNQELRIAISLDLHTYSRIKSLLKTGFVNCKSWGIDPALVCTAKSRFLVRMFPPKALTDMFETCDIRHVTNPDRRRI